MIRLAREWVKKLIGDRPRPVVELTRVAESFCPSSFRHYEMFVISAAIYWLILLEIPRLQRLVERPMHIV